MESLHAYPVGLRGWEIHIDVKAARSYSKRIKVRTTRKPKIADLKRELELAQQRIQGLRNIRKHLALQISNRPSWWKFWNR